MPLPQALPEILPLLEFKDIEAKIRQRSHPAQKSYLAMYSSWWDGIVQDPAAMLIPVDDHLVHRGDGIFEAIKVLDGKVFLLQEHLERLETSAAALDLKLSLSRDEICKVIQQTARVAASTPPFARNLLLRLYVSRGPGGFTANPYDSVGSQIYLVVTAFAPYPAEKYLSGVRIGRSQIPVKEPWLAQSKTCNYLPNVMMKKESVDRRLDFTIGIDQTGFVAESSTENIVILDQHKNLIRPRLHQILKGTTMMRSFELAQSLIDTGILNSVIEKDISETELIKAAEVLMIGTTLDVLPVTQYEGHPIGSGQPGPIALKLLHLLREDMKSGPKTTPILDF